MKRMAESGARESGRYAAARQRMVDRQIAARGIRAERVLDAMRSVPREAFVPHDLVDFAYEDRALPISHGQTISQPYIVALMAAAPRLRSTDRVLEVGTGSGYAAAVFSRIARQVFTVDRHADLVNEAAHRFTALGYRNIEVATGDGTLGWPEHAPFDAIIVAAGGPDVVPRPLKEQLAPGGRLVIPRGETLWGQDLVLIRRAADGRAFAEENLGAVRFVPLIGEAGWAPDDETAISSDPPPAPTAKRATLPDLMARAAEPFDDVSDIDLDPLLARIGDARLVLLGEASHGTTEFYDMRARISRELIEKKGFDLVAVEADWPDAAEIDAYVRHAPASRPHRKPIQRFPRWMWANTDVMAFVHWLRGFNEHRGNGGSRVRTGFHGLDLYSMHTSIDAVLEYLDDVDPFTAALARDRYACLTPWQNDPMLYGRAVLTDALRSCEGEVVRMLEDLLNKRIDYARRDGARFVDGIQNARVIASAEKYYRAMFRGSVSTWNLRDQHMFDTLVTLLDDYGKHSKGIVWAHNSHLGDASATEIGERGELNVGQLCRRAFGSAAYLVGFGTHTGTVAAASNWGEPMQVMTVQASHPRSYEYNAHRSGVKRFFLHLREGMDRDLRRRLDEQHLERAIGVIYRPDSELQSHYFTAFLPRQFDEWIWFDESHAVTPIGEQHRAELEGMPETFPFGL